MSVLVQVVVALAIGAILIRGLDRSLDFLREFAKEVDAADTSQGSELASHGNT